MLLVFLLSLTLCSATLACSARARVVDLPDFKRKVNTVPIPRLGGVGFFIAFFIALGTKILFLSSATPLESSLLFAGGLSLLFGAADDFFPLSPLQKLSCQSVISALGVSLLVPGDSPQLFAGGLLYSVFLMNAFNLIDGLDGLCCGISLSSLLMLAAVDLLILNTGGGICAIFLFFALLGFLPLNVHPAKLYMGDSGSMTLGLSIALISVYYSTGGFHLSAAFFFIPVFDTVLSVFRRVFSGRSPFSADRGHIHHVLLDSGFSHQGTVNLLLILSVSFGLVTLILPLIL